MVKNWLTGKIIENTRSSRIGLQRYGLVTCNSRKSSGLYRKLKIKIFFDIWVQ